MGDFIPGPDIVSRTAPTVGQVTSTGTEYGDSPAGFVTGVAVTAPITSTGGSSPTIGISPATDLAAGSMSAADKTKLDGVGAGANVVAVAAGTNVTITGTVQNPIVNASAGGVAGITTPEAFGAVGDNVHDDQTAFDLAEAAIALGLFRGLELGAKTYYVSGGGILITPGSATFGQGPDATTVRTDANNDIFRLLHCNGCYISGIRFLGDGNGGKTNQIGVESGYLGGDGADVLLVENCVAENMGGRGFSIAYGTGNSPGPILANLRAIACHDQGFGAYTQSTWTNCVAIGCGSSNFASTSAALFIGGGNVVFDGGDLSMNTVGVKILGGGNGAHGITSNTLINHCSVAGIIVQDGCVNGHTFIGIHIYESNIVIGQNEGLIDFRGCVIDPAFFTYTATSLVRYAACSYPQGYGNIDNGLGDVEFDNARAILGGMPPFVGARYFRSFTFANDTDQALSNAQSRARVLEIEAGVLTASRNLVLTRPPARGERIRVINRNAHDVGVLWSSGIGILVTSGHVADVGADGTNAVCELLGVATATTVAVLDPTALALTGLYRGSYGGAPWVGVASAGTSGAHTLQTAGSDPTAGTSLNGHVAAAFAGTELLRDIVTTAEHYISTTAYRVDFLFKLTSVAAPALNVFDNPGILTESGGNWGVVYDSAGVHVYHSSVLVASSAQGIGGISPTDLVLNTWYAGEAVFDGAHVTVTIAGVAGVPGASITTGAIAGAAVFVGANYSQAHEFQGEIEELDISDIPLTGISAADFASYYSTRYGEPV